MEARHASKAQDRWTRLELALKANARSSDVDRHDGCPVRYGFAGGFGNKDAARNLLLRSLIQAQARL
jgi:hypothetical protein